MQVKISQHLIEVYYGKSKDIVNIFVKHAENKDEYRNHAKIKHATIQHLYHILLIESRLGPSGQTVHTFSESFFPSVNHSTNFIDLIK